MKILEKWNINTKLSTMKSSSSKGSGKKAYGSYDNVTVGSVTEQQLLNDLESSTRSIFSNAKILHQETQEQDKLIDSVSDHFDKAHAGLRTETSHIHDTRNEGNDLCWMYSVITGEVLFIIFLLYVGL